MSTPSANAVSSPSTSMMLAFSPASRTFIFTWACGMSFLLVRFISRIPSYSPRRIWSELCRVSSFTSRHRRFGHGALLVREDAHEIREARDVEDLHVVLAQVAGQQTTMRRAGPGEQADYQGDPGRVDVLNTLEVEQDRLRVLGLGLHVGGVQGLLCEAVDLAHQVEHSNVRFQADLYVKVAHSHHLPPS